MVELTGRVDLGRRVPFEGEEGVIRIHSTAVVGHTDEAAASVSQIHLDPCGAGVEAVLDQLLDHRRRTLHHLTGSDAVHELVRENADLRHDEHHTGPIHHAE